MIAWEPSDFAPAVKIESFVSRNKRTRQEISRWWKGMRVKISELAGPRRAEIFQKYPPHQPRCRCVAVTPRASHLLQCFPGNPSHAPAGAPPAPAQRRSGVAVMSLLLARRESRDPRPSGGANHGGLCCWEPEAFDQKEITKATCHSSQSTKHGFEQILKSCFFCYC